MADKVAWVEALSALLAFQAKLVVDLQDLRKCPSVGRVDVIEATESCRKIGCRAEQAGMR